MTRFVASITDYLSAHPTLAILILFLVALGEALLFVGLFVPSTPVMIGAGALAGPGRLSLSPVLVASALGAIAGDALSFWIGRRGKRHLTSVQPLATHPDLLVRGEGFCARQGSPSIFLARFVPVVKAVLPTVAGMAGMPPLRFFVVNVLSALLWSGAHLFPSMLIGRGLGVAATANPKVVKLLLAVLGLAIPAWLTARPLAGRAVPKLAELSQRAATRLAGSDRPWRRRIARHLAQASSPSGILAEATLAIAAGAGLVILAAMILLDPELAGLGRRDPSCRARCPAGPAAVGDGRDARPPPRGVRHARVRGPRPAGPGPAADSRNDGDGRPGRPGRAGRRLGWRNSGGAERQGAARPPAAGSQNRIGRGRLR